MAFVDTFDSFNKNLRGTYPLNALTIEHTIIGPDEVTIDPNVGFFFELTNINVSYLRIHLNGYSDITNKCYTIYLKLSFENKNCVIDWLPLSIVWNDITPPDISSKELFISFTTFDNGRTYIASTLTKIKPYVSMRNYMKNTYPSNYNTISDLPNEMFYYLNSIIVTDLYGAFNGCNNLSSTNGFLTSLDTSNVSSMEDTFAWCGKLSNIDLTSWDTSNLSTTKGMFGAAGMTSLDLSTWTTPVLYTSNSMFYLCSPLKVLDISGWSTSSLSDTTNMFYGITLDYLIIDSNSVFNIQDDKCGSINSSCKILVPQSMISSYQSHSYWSSKSGQFYAIENYTITRSNGTVTVVPNT